MSIKIKLSERQQKLAAGELEDEQPVGDAETLEDAGFDIEEVDTSDDQPDNDDGIDPSGEYIEDAGDADDPGQAEEEAAETWIDDSAKSYAESYGLNEEDLKQFSSLEELERFGTLVDKRLAEETSSTGQPSVGESDGEEEAEQAGDAGSAEAGLLSRLKPLDRKKYEEANYGQQELELVDQLNGVIDAVRQFAPFVEGQQQLQAQEQELQQIAEFDKTLDNFDPQFYGRVYNGDQKAESLGDAFNSNRRMVWDTVERLTKGIMADAERRGVEPKVPPMAVLTQRAANIVSGKLEAPPTGKPQAQEVAKQSRRRRPVGSGGTRGTVGRTSGKKQTSEADEVKALANNPDIANFFKKAQRENGAI